MNTPSPYTDSDYMELSPEEIEAVAHTVRHYHGFDFRNYAPSSFKRRLARIITLYKLKNSQQLIRRLETDKAFYDEFLHEITVNTTEMFRDPAVWRRLRRLFQEHYAQRETIRLWHAGASTGEEVHSMAIMLHELGMLDRVDATASDISQKVLEQARMGKVHARNFSLYEDNYRNAEGTRRLGDYFTKKDDYYFIDPSLLRNASFVHHDLVQDQPMARFDMVLCRNVLIYFDAKLQDQVIQKFYRSMVPGAFLSLGTKESLVMSSLSNKFSALDKELKIFQLKKT